jgi:diguanylate cyclase (GGDEF)-like protein/PAS domain S-box-containing protein
MNNKHHRIAARTAGLYAVAAGLWIVFSDKLLLVIAQDAAAITALQTAKGWFFVLATAVLLFFLVARDMDAIGHSAEELRQRNEALARANEDLTAVGEELRQQFDELTANQAKIFRQNECLLTLRETAFALIHELDADNLLRLIVEKAAAIGESSHAYIYTLTADGQEMELKIIIGTPIREAGYRQKRGEGIIGRVWETGQPFVVHDYHQWPGRIKNKGFSVIRTATGFPLVAGGQVIGVFGVNYFDHHPLDESDLDLLASFAELASIALVNARLLGSLREELAERAKIEADLKRQQDRTRALLDAIPDLILRFSADGILLDCKPGFDMRTTTKFSDFIGRHISEFTPPDILDKVTHYMREAIETRVTQQFEYEAVADSGVVYHREMRIVAAADDEVIGIVRDITKRREMELELKHMSLTDQATGLYNRAFFEAELRRLSDQRYQPVGVIVCDIDGLKFINDTLGHDTGDILIAAAAYMLASCFGAGDVVARIGGGEFGIIMPNSDPAVVGEACERIRNAAASYRAASKMPLSISVGMDVCTGGETTLNETYKNADRNMYREKLHSQQSGHSAIVATLAQALEARDFVTDGTPTACSTSWKNWPSPPACRPATCPTSGCSAVSTTLAKSASPTKSSSNQPPHRRRI